MKHRNIAPMWVAKAGYIVISALFCGLGILFIVHPLASVTLICRILGAALSVFGAVKLVGYFSRDLYRLAFQFDLQFGILLLVLGLALLIHPLPVVNLLCVGLGVAMLADALFRIRTAVEAKRFGITVWWLILGLAIAVGIVGLLLLFRPRDSVRFMTMLLGVSLLAEGVLSLAVGLSMVSIVRHQLPDEDVIEAEGREVDD